MNWEAFFTLHKDLPREGPGLPEHVHWALARMPKPARVLDAACGPGADTQTLADALPEARIDAVEMQASFVAEAQARLGTRARVWEGDMFAADGPYDLIWCAGAVYFVGVTEALTRWRKALAPGGHIAFSEALKPDADAPQAAHDFWADYSQIADLQGHKAQIATAGYRLIDHTVVQGAAWEAYYTPQQARIDQLRAQDPSDDLRAVLDEGQREIDLWRAARDHVVYNLYLVCPDA